MATTAAAFCLVFIGLAFADPTVHFREDFDEGWESRWVESTHKGAEAGKFKWSAGKFYSDPAKDKGIQTSQDAKFYALSSKFDKPFSNEGKTLVVQFTVKHEQEIDCGGGYVKVFGSDLDQKDMHGDSAYKIMFGPDICGYSTKKVHVIFNYKGKNHLISKEVRAESDSHTHLYTLIVNADQTFKVLVDNKEVRSGSLPADWDFLPPKEIKDPSKSKPADWVDDKEIPDPEAKKPEGWDDIPAQIKDPDAKKPEDWDDELDGEWEAPLIDNPEYKGEWKAAKIPNPAYKGEWVHPLIPNPDYYEDNEIYAYDSHQFLGIEIWQVKSGTIFDNFLVTDSVETASEWAEKTLKTREGEKAAEDKDLEEKKKNAPAEEEGEELELEDEDLAAEELHDEL